jgi:hypothetical protein
VRLAPPRSLLHLAAAVLAVTAAPAAAGAATATATGGDRGDRGGSIGAGGRGGAVGTGGAAGAAGARTRPEGTVLVPAGRTTELVVVPGRGRPIDREPELAARAPSYRLAVARDGELRFAEAVVLYQQAGFELSAALRLGSSPALEVALMKTDRERQRSLALAAMPDDPSPFPGTTPRPLGQRASPIQRARMLRAKLMTVLATTGVASPGLLTETLRAFDQSLRASSFTGAGGDPEVRLYLCATRAAAGDRDRARLELAHVSSRDRLDPANALAAATCAAALGDDDGALGSLAVAVHRLLPPDRVDLGQTREVYLSNDWDRLRGQPRFESLFPPPG